MEKKERAFGGQSVPDFEWSGRRDGFVLSNMHGYFTAACPAEMKSTASI